MGPTRVNKPIRSDKGGRCGAAHSAESAPVHAAPRHQRRLRASGSVFVATRPAGAVWWCQTIRQLGQISPPFDRARTRSTRSTCGRHPVQGRNSNGSTFPVKAPEQTRPSNSLQDMAFATVLFTQSTFKACYFLGKALSLSLHYLTSCKLILNDYNCSGMGRIFPQQFRQPR